LVQATYYNNHIVLEPSRNIQVIHSNKEFAHQNMLIGLGTGKCPKNPVSMDWFKGKSTGNHGFLPSNIGLSCKFPHHPIL